VIQKNVKKEEVCVDVSIYISLIKRKNGLKILQSIESKNPFILIQKIKINNNRLSERNFLDIYY